MNAVLEFDSMALLAKDESFVGLIFHCSNDNCRKRRWKDFSDFPDTLTLRSIRARAVCSHCKNAGGRGSVIELVNLPLSAPEITEDLREQRRQWTEDLRKQIERRPVY